MNLKQLKYVFVLANSESFSAAAEELGISQPSLSQYIKKIEKQIGISLFDRVNGCVRLTDAGRIYLEYGEKIINFEHQMENEIQDISSFKKGTVIVGTSPYRCATMMPDVASAFKNFYPGIQLQVEEDVTSRLVERTEKGEFDLCITMLPVNEKLFAFEHVLEEELIVAAPKSFPELKSSIDCHHKYPVIDISQIDKQDFVMITESQVLQRTLNELCIDYGLTLKSSTVVKSLEAQINMVRAGLGMALVPTGIEKLCNKDEIRFYSIKQDLPRRQVVAMWRKDQKLPETVKSLLQVIHNTYI